MSKHVFSGTREEWMSRVLPSVSTDEECHTYWIYDEECLRPEDHGYIGVATVKRFAARCCEHCRSKRFPTDSKIRIIFTGNIEGAYLYEAVLRPYPNMGWNKAAGGARGHRIGMPMSAETKNKISSANTGNKRPDLSKRNALTNSSRFQNLVCPHCGKNGSGPTMMRYHFKNCKRSEKL